MRSVNFVLNQRSGVFLDHFAHSELAWEKKEKIGEPYFQFHMKRLFSLAEWEDFLPNCTVKSFYHANNA